MTELDSSAAPSARDLSVILQARTAELAKRMREMRCLCAVSRLLLDGRDDASDVFGKIARALPPAMQFPDQAVAELEIDGVSYATGARESLSAELRVPLMIGERRLGSVAVGYRALPECREPFLDEERALLEAVADRVLETVRRRAAEDALRHTAAYHQSLIENARDLIVLLSHDAKFTYVSPSMRATLGRSPQSLLGRSAFDIIHPEDLAAVRDAFTRGLREPGTVTRVEYRARHADGTYRVFESTGTNLFDDPAVRAMVVNSRDVTDRRALEAQFRQAQKMEAVGRLAGGIAHDFNNLLTVMSTSCDILLRDLRDPRELEEVQAIQGATERATTLTRQLLAFSRKQMLKPQVLTVNGVVAGLEKLVRRLIGEDIEVATILDPAVGNSRLDPGQLEQLLLNLVVNARDAMPHGGRLTLRTSTVPPAEVPEAIADRGAHWVMISIADTGEGMTAEVREHAFEPFFTTKPRGTGLGLATVYGIVAQSGGHVAVDSEPGRGTTFCIYFPLVNGRPSDTAEGSPRDLARASHPASILLVEDEAGVRSVVKRILVRAGYDVSDASCAADAEALIAGGARFDLLVSDVVLPGVTGPTLAASLMRRFPALKALFMTGYNDETIHGRIAPGAPLLEKPFTPDALVRTVRELLATRDAASA